jgi:hypothetical protein
VISDGFDSPRPGLPRHGGVDVMFARKPADAFKAGSPNGSKLFVMPDALAAVAASDGAVWSAMQTPHGFAVVIDHGPSKVATFYTHLEKLLVAPATPGKSSERVHAGQPIGIIGASPLDGEHLKHLHFEVWLGGPNDRIDPSALMRGWEVVTDARSLVAVATTVPATSPIRGAVNLRWTSMVLPPQCTSPMARCQPDSRPVGTPSPAPSAVGMGLRGPSALASNHTRPGRGRPQRARLDDISIPESFAFGKEQA